MAEVTCAAIRQLVVFLQVELGYFSGAHVSASVGIAGHAGISLSPVSICLDSVNRLQCPFMLG